MERIPLLACKRRTSTEIFADESSNTEPSANIHSINTPIRNNNPSEDEDSPYFPCSTQEMHDDVDVLWDWNSPQSKPKTLIRRRSKKKLNLQNSPKVPFRRHPSNNEQRKQDFDKLREELKALKAEIAKPDHEASLILSPREEEAYRKEENETGIESLHDFDHNVMEDLDIDDFRDPFDDDMDEHLILCSQQIESTIEKSKHTLGISTVNTLSSKKVSNNFSNSSLKRPHAQLLDKNQPHLPKIMINDSDNRYTGIKTHQNNSPVMFQNKTEPKSYCQNSVTPNLKKQQVTSLQDSDVFNDSLDIVLSQINDEDLDQLTQVVDIKQYKNGNNDFKVDKKPKVFPRSQSEDFIITQPIPVTNRKVEWHRTQSFESYNDQLSKEKLLEIERKRLEAKAKRDAKKKQDVIFPTITEVTEIPLPISPDEIERKRRQALEKLEAKRLQDIIEKKKQEALKRREENRQKKAANVKSSLATRL